MTLTLADAAPAVRKGMLLARNYAAAWHMDQSKSSGRADLTQNAGDALQLHMQAMADREKQLQYGLEDLLTLFKHYEQYDPDYREMSIARVRKLVEPK